MYLPYLCWHFKSINIPQEKHNLVRSYEHIKAYRNFNLRAFPGRFLLFLAAEQ